MNIIKFKDEISGNEWFDTNLKGKYAYWIRMTWATPLEVTSLGQYIEYEQDGVPAGDTPSDEWPFILTSTIEELVDTTETDAANTTTQFTLYNSYSTDSDITLDELKVFRRWLAETLLGFDTELNYDDNTKHMLQYYVADMYDDTVNWLTQFGKPEYSVSVLNNQYQKPTGCGCSGVGQNLSSLYNTTLASCDPVGVYRKNIWKLMVDTFSNIEFWKQMSTPFLSEFKKYIDNILKAGLPLSSSEWISVFADCVCGQTPDGTNTAILVRLSESLGYLIDSETGHDNFIQKSFNDWSSILYEKMFWA